MLFGDIYVVEMGGMMICRKFGAMILIRGLALFGGSFT